MNPLISGLFALIGVLIGGGISYLTSLHKTALDNKWKRDENIQKRLEEAHETAEEVKQGFLTAAANGMKKVHFGEELPVGRKIPIEKLRMLTEFYAPESVAEYRLILEKRELFSTPFVKVITSGKLPKAEAQAISGELMSASKQIEKACTKYQECILQIARSLKVTRNAQS